MHDLRMADTTTREDSTEKPLPSRAQPIRMLDGNWRHRMFESCFSTGITGKVSNEGFLFACASGSSQRYAKYTVGKPEITRRHFRSQRNCTIAHNFPNMCTDLDERYSHPFFRRCVAILLFKSIRLPAHNAKPHHYLPLQQSIKCIQMIRRRPFMLRSIVRALWPTSYRWDSPNNLPKRTDTLTHVAVFSQ